MKKILAALLSVMLLLSAATAVFAEERGFALNYPETMQALGYTEPLVLDKMPEKIALMSTAPVLALYELGVNMIAVPSTSLVEWPEDLLAQTQILQAGMNSSFDIETVIALEPDLVIMPYASQDTYGIVLESVNIPVYYVDAGHTVSYESIKEQTQVLIDAFAPGSEAGAGIMQRFADLEARLDDMKQSMEGKSVMVLQSSPPTHYIQTADGTLGSMADMIGLTNVYENSASSMVEMDYELVLSYDPDLLLCVGSSETADGHRAVMEEDYANNPEYWAAISAISEGNVIYLPVTFVSSAGINIVDNITALADIIEVHFAM